MSSENWSGGGEPLPGGSALYQSANWKFQNNWPTKDSFFDDAVQEILEERHPGKIGNRNDVEKRYAIWAWQSADQFALTRESPDFQTILKEDTEWAGNLIASIAKYYRESTPKSDSIKGKLNQWQRRLAPAQKWNDVAFEILGKKKIKGDGTNAIRQAHFKENKRRLKIVRHWAESWLAWYRLHGLECSEAQLLSQFNSVTDLPKNK